MLELIRSHRENINIHEETQKKIQEENERYTGYITDGKDIMEGFIIYMGDEDRNSAVELKDKQATSMPIITNLRKKENQLKREIDELRSEIRLLESENHIRLEI